MFKALEMPPVAVNATTAAPAAAIVPVTTFPAVDTVLLTTLAALEPTELALPKNVSSLLCDLEIPLSKLEPS
jgi:hypothetical protein